MLRRTGMMKRMLVSSMIVVPAVLFAGIYDPDLPSVKEYRPQSVNDGSSNAVPLTLEACVRIARSANPAAAAAKEGVLAAGANAQAAAGPEYPSASLYGSYRRWETHAFLPSGLLPPTASAPGVMGPTDDWSGGVKGSWMLFDSGEARSRLVSARARLGRVDAEAAGVMQDIVLNVHRAYFSMMSAGQLLSVAGTNLVRTSQHLDSVTKKQAAGSAVDADVLRAGTVVADARLSLVRARSMVRIAQGNLNAAMGLPVETPVEINPAAAPVAAGVPDVSALFELALANRPEITAELFNVAAARSAISAARAEFGPKVRLDGFYGKRDDNFLPEDNDWSVGVSMEIPLFSGFSSVNRLSAARRELSVEEAKARQLVLLVRQEVWTAFQKTKESGEALQASESFFTDASESMRAMKLRYDSGACTLTDLLDAQSTLLRAEAGLVQSRWDFQLSRSVLDRATGTLCRE